jgi:hypothetical protein
MRVTIFNVGNGPTEKYRPGGLMSAAEARADQICSGRGLPVVTPSRQGLFEIPQRSTARCGMVPSVA